MHLALLFHSSTNHSGNRVQSVKQGLQANSCSAQWEIVQNSFFQPLCKKGCSTSTNADSLAKYDALMTHTVVSVTVSRTTAKNFLFPCVKSFALQYFAMINSVTNINYFSIISPIDSHLIVLPNCFKR